MGDTERECEKTEGLTESEGQPKKHRLYYIALWPTVRPEIGKNEERGEELGEEKRESSIPEDWVLDQLKSCRLLTFHGEKVTDLSRDELIAVVAYLTEENARMKDNLFYPSYPY